MNSYYQSHDRFVNTIIKRWQKRGFKYHDGHVQLLKWSYRTLMYWSTLKGLKVSKINKVETTLKLF